MRYNTFHCARPSGRPVASMWPLCVALAVLLAAGCTKITQPIQQVLSADKKAAAKSMPPAGPTKVQVDSTALALNQPEQELAVKRNFVERFQKLIDEQRRRAAERWVQRHPDLAWEALREAQPPHEAWLLELARIHDAQCVGNPNQGWHALLAGRHAAPQRDAAYRDARSQLMQLLHSGRFSTTSEIDLVGPAREAGHPLLEIDAWHQMGIAHLLAEEPQNSVEALQQAAELARTHAPQQAVHIELLLSEARRRAGDQQGAARTWAAAVEAGADLLARPTPIADPTFWSRAMYLRPISQQWPAKVVQRLEQLAAHGAGPATTDEMRRVVAADAEQQLPLVYIAACLGGWKLERGDPQGAIIELKKAETVASPPMVDWLRIAQAKAMASLEQSAAATALLTPIAGREEATPVRQAALADLGALQLREGRVPQGVNLLRRALDQQQAAEWPGKISAEADLALALLMLGEETEGLQRLDQAKRKFEAAGDDESLAKCLWNEVQYLQQTKDKKKKAELAAVQKRLTSLQL